MRMCVLAFVVCACGGGVRIPAKPSMAVIDAGAEPRQVLRYVQSPGTTERAELTLKQRLHTAYTNTTLEEGKQDVDMPSLVLRGPMTIENVSAAGALITFTIDEVSTLEDVVDPTIRRVVAAVHDRVLHQQVSWRRGTNGTAELVKVPPSMDAVAWKQPLFPEVAVGVGARWQVTMATTVNGVRLRATTTYRVAELTETSVTIDAETELVAPEQALSVEPNATVHLTSGSGHGTSHAVIPLTGLVPTMQESITIEMNLLVTRGHLRITATQTHEQITATRRLD